LFLCVAALPPTIKSLLVHRIQRFAEGNVVHHMNYVLNQDRMCACSWAAETVKLSEVLDLNQLTFTVDFDVLEAVDDDGNRISPKWFAVEEKSQRKALESKLVAAQKEQMANAEVAIDRDIPEAFLCPITHRVMRDPVLAFDGRSYEREAIEEYLKKHNKSPVTGAEAMTTISMVFPNHELSSRIIEFIEAQEMVSEEGQSKEGEGETTFE